MVFATTSNPILLNEMGMLDGFTATLGVPPVAPGPEMKAVLKTLNLFSNAELDEAVAHILRPVPIKKLLQLSDTAQHGEGGTVLQRFLQCIEDYVISNLTLPM